MNRILTTAGLTLALSMAVAAPADAQQRDGERGKPRAERQQGQMGHAYMNRALFRGIELSEAQRTSIASIRESYRPRMQALREASRESMTTARAARQRGDTAAARAAMAPHREQMQSLMTAHRNELRQVLTADQRTQFDRNIQEMRTRAEQRPNRGQRDGERRQRGQRTGRTATQG